MSAMEAMINELTENCYIGIHQEIDTQVPNGMMKNHALAILNAMRNDTRFLIQLGNILREEKPNAMLEVVAILTNIE